MAIEQLLLCENVKHELNWLIFNIYIHGLMTLRFLFNIYFKSRRVALSCERIEDLVGFKIGK